jgi:hypothetical protein
MKLSSIIDSTATKPNEEAKTPLWTVHEYLHIEAIVDISMVDIAISYKTPPDNSTLRPIQAPGSNLHFANSKCPIHSKTP